MRRAPPRKQDVSHIQILSQVKTREVARYFAVHNNTPRSNDIDIFIGLIFYLALLQILDNCGGSVASGGNFPLEVIFRDQSSVIRDLWKIINKEIINNQRVSKLKHFPAGERPGAGQQGIEANILSFVSKVFFSARIMAAVCLPNIASQRKAYSLSQNWDVSNPKYVWVGIWVPPFWTKYKSY